MRTKLVDEFPKCDYSDDFPHPNGNNALYDAPTANGSWAYLCEECLKSLCNVKSAIHLGIKFKLRSPFEGEKPNKPVRAVEPGFEDIEYWESVVFDGLRTPECGHCGEIRTMEPDATQFTCEGCGAKNIMAMGLC